MAEDLDFEVLSRADSSVFHEPQCLIDSDPSGKLVANQSTLDQIMQIDKPLNIVAIAGLYRTGKSYLMNRLAGKNKGFSLGSTIQSMTKGIWVWCGPHPVREDEVLVLLDTEGLGDVEKGDQNHDNWIFALATLLSNTLVYNTLGALDQDAIEKLNFVTEISKHIKAREDDNNNAGKNNMDYDLYFPGFVVALRDFTLQLVLDGREITSDEYLDHCLSLRPEKDEKNRKFNEPRRCIRRYFKQHKCFTFDRPAGRLKLQRLEELTDDEINEDFLEESAAFCSYIHACEGKKLDTGMPVRGSMFVTLVNTYVDSIRNGTVPCIENALHTMAIIENTKATEESVRLYQKTMSDTIQMPTETDAVVSDAHHDSVKEAVAYFLKKAIYDEGNEFQRKMNDQLKEEFELIKSKNEEVSEQKCKNVLQTLNVSILDKLKSGGYMCAGGYADYQQDLHKLQIQFEGQRGLGVKAKDAILTFLHEKWSEGQTILAGDQKVSEEEKKAEVARQKALEAERLRETAEREAKLTEAHAKDIERMLKQNVEQLENRREEDLKNMKNHYDEIIQKRMEEQKRTYEEGFKKDADNMRTHIDQLEREKTSAKSKKCFADTSLVKVKGPNGGVMVKLLSNLNIGDRVESFDIQTGEVVFSVVYFITHSGEGNTYGSDLLYLKHTATQEESIHSDKQTGIRLDASHLLYVSRADEMSVRPPEQPIKASEVLLGDQLWVKGKSGLEPKEVVEIRKVKSGVRHPMTMNHVIIVDGILASVHMHHERLYRVLTSPLRILYSYSPWAVKSSFVRNVVNAWDYVENFL